MILNFSLQVRRAFIRKVYGILSCQLLLTCAIISVFTFIPSARLYAQQNRWMYWVGFAATLGTVTETYSRIFDLAN